MSNVWHQTSQLRVMISIQFTQTALKSTENWNVTIFPLYLMKSVFLIIESLQNIFKSVSNMIVEKNCRVSMRLSAKPLVPYSRVDKDIDNVLTKKVQVYVDQSSIGFLYPLHPTLPNLVKVPTFAHLNRALTEMSLTLTTTEQKWFRQHSFNCPPLESNIPQRSSTRKTNKCKKLSCDETNPLMKRKPLITVQVELVRTKERTSNSKVKKEQEVLSPPSTCCRHDESFTYTPHPKAPPFQLIWRMSGFNQYLCISVIILVISRVFYGHCVCLSTSPWESIYRCSLHQF